MTLSSSVPQWLNFATGVVDLEDPSLDNRLGAVHQNKISLLIKKDLAKMCLERFCRNFGQGG